ncbi:MAG: S-layer homology domain-containing protein [Eubacteriales bacterium]
MNHKNDRFLVGILASTFLLAPVSNATAQELEELSPQSAENQYQIPENSPEQAQGSETTNKVSQAFAGLINEGLPQIGEIFQVVVTDPEPELEIEPDLEIEPETEYVPESKPQPEPEPEPEPQYQHAQEADRLQSQAALSTPTPYTTGVYGGFTIYTDDALTQKYSGSGITVSGNKVTINTTDQIYIRNTDVYSVTSDVILVNCPTGTANITLAGVNMTQSNTNIRITFQTNTNLALMGENSCLLALENSAEVTINEVANASGDLLDTAPNQYHLRPTKWNLKAVGGSLVPGILVEKGAHLIVESGSISSAGGAEAAGIGGTRKLDCGNITIRGGYVYATAGQSSAGIGGSSGSNCGNINISGGTVVASGSFAGIGYGNGGSAANSGKFTTDTASGTAGNAFIYIKNNIKMSYTIKELDMVFLNTTGTVTDPSNNYSPHLMHRGDVFGTVTLTEDVTIPQYSPTYGTSYRVVIDVTGEVTDVAGHNYLHSGSSPGKLTNNGILRRPIQKTASSPTEKDLLHEGNIGGTGLILLLVDDTLPFATPQGNDSESLVVCPLPSGSYFEYGNPLYNPYMNDHGTTKNIAACFDFVHVNQFGEVDDTVFALNNDANAPLPAGTYSITMTGGKFDPSSYYVGSLTYSYEITAKDISAATIAATSQLTLDLGGRPEIGDSALADITVTLYGETVPLPYVNPNYAASGGNDYEHNYILSFGAFVPGSTDPNIGTIEVTATGIGNYTGTTSTSTIAAAKKEDKEVTGEENFDDANYIYTVELASDIVYMRPDGTIDDSTIQLILMEAPQSDPTQKTRSEIGGVVNGILIQELHYNVKSTAVIEGEKIFEIVLNAGQMSSSPGNITFELEVIQAGEGTDNAFNKGEINLVDQWYARPDGTYNEEDVRLTTYPKISGTESTTETTLKLGTDFTFKYSGTTATVTATGSTYSNSVVFKYNQGEAGTGTSNDLSQGVIDSVLNQVWYQRPDGKYYPEDLSLTAYGQTVYGETPMVLNTDYTLVDHLNGTVTVTAKSGSPYQGTTTFKVDKEKAGAGTGTDFSEGIIDIVTDGWYYERSEDGVVLLEPKDLVIKVDGTPLDVNTAQDTESGPQVAPGADYNLEVGDLQTDASGREFVVVTVTGVNGYTGSITFEVTVDAAPPAPQVDTSTNSPATSTPSPPVYVRPTITVTPPSIESSTAEDKSEITIPILPTEVVGVVTGTLEKDDVTNAFTSTNADTKDEIGVTIVPNGVTASGTTLNSQENVTYTFEKDAISALLDNNTSYLTVKLTNITITFDRDAITHINNSVTSEAVLSVVAVSNSSLTDRPIYQIKVTDQAGKEIEDFGTGLSTVRISYIRPTSDVRDLLAGYMDENGVIQFSPLSYYDAYNRQLVFTTDSFETYGIIDREGTVVFESPSRHWASDSLTFAINRELFSGAGYLDPDAPITRAQFVTALSRLEEIMQGSYSTSYFMDVEISSYYSAGVQWAFVNGVAHGTGLAEFSPDAPITREQMAVMLNKFCQKFGIDLDKYDTTTSYPDRSDVSDYAVSAVDKIYGAGLVSGKEGNRFGSKESTTVAEAAIILQNYVKELAESNQLRL